MARESLRAAYLLEVGNCWRPSASRYYYAAYQAVTAVLLYLGRTPPEDREAWSHEVTPQMIQEHFTQVVRSRRKRNDLVSQLDYLYKLRVYADYISNQQVGEEKIKIVSKYARHIVRVAESVLQEG